MKNTLFLTLGTLQSVAVDKQMVAVWFDRGCSRRILVTYLKMGSSEKASCKSWLQQSTEGLLKKMRKSLPGRRSKCPKGAVWEWALFLLGSSKELLVELLQSVRLRLCKVTEGPVGHARVWTFILCPWGAPGVREGWDENSGLDRIDLVPV